MTLDRTSNNTPSLVTEPLVHEEPSVQPQNATLSHAPPPPTSTGQQQELEPASTAGGHDQRPIDTESLQATNTDRPGSSSEQPLHGATLAQIRKHLGSEYLVIRKDHVAYLAANSLLSASQVEPLWSALELAVQNDDIGADDAAGAVPADGDDAEGILPDISLAHVLYFFGALLVISAFSFFMGFGWLRMFAGDIGAMVVSSTLGFAFFWAAGSLYENHRFTAAGLLYTMSASTIPVLCFALQHRFQASFRSAFNQQLKGTSAERQGAEAPKQLFFAGARWGNSSPHWVVMELATLLAGLVLYAFVMPFGFLSNLVWVSLVYLCRDLPPLLKRTATPTELAVMSVLGGNAVAAVALVLYTTAAALAISDGSGASTAHEATTDVAGAGPLWLDHGVLHSTAWWGATVALVGLFQLYGQLDRVYRGPQLVSAMLAELFLLMALPLGYCVLPSFGFAVIPTIYMHVATAALFASVTGLLAHSLRYVAAIRHQRSTTAATATAAAAATTTTTSTTTASTSSTANFDCSWSSVQVIALMMKVSLPMALVFFVAPYVPRALGESSVLASMLTTAYGSTTLFAATCHLIATCSVVLVLINATDSAKEPLVQVLGIEASALVVLAVGGIVWRIQVLVWLAPIALTCTAIHSTEWLSGQRNSRSTLLVALGMLFSIDLVAHFVVPRGAESLSIALQGGNSLSVLGILLINTRAYIHSLAISKAQPPKKVAEIAAHLATYAAMAFTAIAYCMSAVQLVSPIVGSLALLLVLVVDANAPNELKALTLPPENPRRSSGVSTSKPSVRRRAEIRWRRVLERYSALVGFRLQRIGLESMAIGGSLGVLAFLGQLVYTAGLLPDLAVLDEVRLALSWAAVLTFWAGMLLSYVHWFVLSVLLPMLVDISRASTAVQARTSTSTAVPAPSTDASAASSEATAAKVTRRILAFWLAHEVLFALALVLRSSSLLFLTGTLGHLACAVMVVLACSWHGRTIELVLLQLPQFAHLLVSAGLRSSGLATINGMLIELVSLATLALLGIGIDSTLRRYWDVPAVNNWIVGLVLLLLSVSELFSISRGSMMLFFGLGFVLLAYMRTLGWQTAIHRLANGFSTVLFGRSIRASPPPTSATTTTTSVTTATGTTGAVLIDTTLEMPWLVLATLICVSLLVLSKMLESQWLFVLPLAMLAFKDYCAFKKKLRGASFDGMVASVAILLTSAIIQSRLLLLIAAVSLFYRLARLAAVMFASAALPIGLIVAGVASIVLGLKYEAIAEGSAVLLENFPQLAVSFADRWVAVIESFAVYIVGFHL